MSTLMQAASILSGLILLVVAWVRFNKPPTNRAGTTFLLFYSGVGFYYSLLIALWLLVILLLAGGGAGLSLLGAAVHNAVKDNEQLSAMLPVVAMLIVVVASQFKRIRNIDTAARSFCVALAAIPGRADQLAMELAHNADFRVVNPELIKGITQEIIKNIGRDAVNFGNDGTASSRFTRAVALYWLFVIPNDTGTPLPFRTNAASRSAYARIMGLNDKMIEQSIKSYDAMMEQGLGYFSAANHTRQMDEQFKRSVQNLSHVVCGLIARYVLFKNVTAGQRRRRLASMGFDLQDHLQALGRDQWLATILAIIVLSSSLSILVPGQQSIPLVLAYSALVAVQLGIASIGGTVVAQRFIRRDDDRRFPPLAELIVAALVVSTICIALRIGWFVLPSLLTTGQLGLTASIGRFLERWAFILLPFVCTISIGLLGSYLGTCRRGWMQVAALGGIFNGLAFAAVGFLIGHLLPELMVTQSGAQSDWAMLILTGNIGLIGTALGAIVLTIFPHSMLSVGKTGGAGPSPSANDAAALPTIGNLVVRAFGEIASPPSAVASLERGGYLQQSVEELEGRYVCFRPSFSNPDVINAYLVLIRWDEKRCCLVFEEQSRPDSVHTQNGVVYVPDGKPFLNLVTIDKGSVRVIMVARPLEGLARGIIMTLSTPGGPHYIPAAAPVALRRVGEITPQLGFVHRNEHDYDLYLSELQSVEPHFANFANKIVASTRANLRAVKRATSA